MIKKGNHEGRESRRVLRRGATGNLIRTCCRE
jgi:hypothetical protein